MIFFCRYSRLAYLQQHVVSYPDCRLAVKYREQQHHCNSEKSYTHNKSGYFPAMSVAIWASALITLVKKEKCRVYITAVAAGIPAGIIFSKSDAFASLRPGNECPFRLEQAALKINNAGCFKPHPLFRPVNFCRDYINLQCRATADNSLNNSLLRTASVNISHNCIADTYPFRLYIYE